VGTITAAFDMRVQNRLDRFHLVHGEELSQADESALYHHFELNYTPISTQSGRRLARR
jgi:phosphoketolase